MKQKIIFFGICTTFFLLACKKTESTGGGGNNGGGGFVDCGSVKFSANILPMINSKCATAGCHDAASSNGPGALTNYQQIFTNRVSISSSVNANRMPQGGPALSSTEKAYITCWIDAGAPNN